MVKPPPPSRERQEGIIDLLYDLNTLETSFADWKRLLSIYLSQLDDNTLSEISATVKSSSEVREELQRRGQELREKGIVIKDTEMEPFLLFALTKFPQLQEIYQRQPNLPMWRVFRSVTYALESELEKKLQDKDLGRRKFIDQERVLLMAVDFLKKLPELERLRKTQREEEKRKKEKEVGEKAYAKVIEGIDLLLATQESTESAITMERIFEELVEIERNLRDDVGSRLSYPLYRLQQVLTPYRKIIGEKLKRLRVKNPQLWIEFCERFFGRNEIWGEHPYLRIDREEIPDQLWKLKIGRRNYLVISAYKMEYLLGSPSSATEGTILIAIEEKSGEFRAIKLYAPNRKSFVTRILEKIMKQNEKKRKWTNEEILQEELYEGPVITGHLLWKYGGPTHRLPLFYEMGALTIDLVTGKTESQEFLPDSKGGIWLGGDLHKLMGSRNGAIVTLPYIIMEAVFGPTISSDRIFGSLKDKFMKNFPAGYIGLDVEVTITATDPPEMLEEMEKLNDKMMPPEQKEHLLAHIQDWRIIDLGVVEPSSEEAKNEVVNMTRAFWGLY